MGFLRVAWQKSASWNLNLEESELSNIVSGVFTPMLAHHSKSFSRIDCISVRVDRVERNFEPMQKQVDPGDQTSPSRAFQQVRIPQTSEAITPREPLISLTVRSHSYRLG
jgi:hypothetical protein